MDEKGDVVAGILCCGHCANRGKKTDGREMGDLKGRKTGRKLQRFMVAGDGAQLADGGRDAWRCWWFWKFEMSPGSPRHLAWEVRTTTAAMSMS